MGIKTILVVQLVKIGQDGVMGIYYAAMRRKDSDNKSLPDLIENLKEELPKAP
jgi:hypothetical protein